MNKKVLTIFISIIVGFLLASLSYYLTITKDKKPISYGDCVTIARTVSRGYPVHYYQSLSNAGDCDIYLNATTFKLTNYLIDALVWSFGAGVVISVIGKIRVKK